MSIRSSLLLLGLAAALASSAGAQEPTIITTAPYTITKAGKYQLGADLFFAGYGENFAPLITIAVGNVTLDFNGHYISGPVNSPKSQVIGVYAEERGNLTIKNGTIAFCSTGVFLSGNGNSSTRNINQRVENMLVSYCYADGVGIYRSQNSEVRNCRISFTGGTENFTDTSGINGYGSIGLKITNNVVTGVTTVIDGGTAYGIYGGTSTFAVGNTVSDCGQAIFNCHCQQNLTSACTTYYSSCIDAGLNN